MSHEITQSDGFFTVRQSAWHGLGTVFEDYPSRKEAQALAHPWEPQAQAIYRKNSHSVEVPLPEGSKRFEVRNKEYGSVVWQFDTLEEAGNYVLNAVGNPQIIDLGRRTVDVDQEVEGWVANVREDNDHVLGVVPKSYELVMNSRLWDVAEALENSGSDVMFETGGSLRGGAHVWILVRLKEPLIIKGDKRGETIPYFALQNSHDGAGAFKGQATLTRIVCANTARVSDLDAKSRGTEFTFRHSSKIEGRIEEAQAALAGWRMAAASAAEMLENLIKRQLVDEGMPDFLKRFIPMPPPGMASEKTEQNVVDARTQWRECYQGFTGEGLENTAYGLVQASIEYQEWCRKANSSESRFKRSFLTKNQIVSSAVAIAMDVSR